MILKPVFIIGIIVVCIGLIVLASYSGDNYGTEWQKWIGLLLDLFEFINNFINAIFT
tara:strand:- start:598 stop:768 length:171 start_codon:yes stop_codon:yes gene_type:complete